MPTPAETLIFGVSIKAKLNLLSNFRRKIFTLRKYEILERAIAELSGNWLTNCLVDQIPNHQSTLMKMAPSLLMMN
jgi:hypothetical protein